MKAQFIDVHIYMATTITFVIHIVMKGKSPPSIMCTTMTNAFKLKRDNDTIIMKMLHKRKCTSPNKPYFTPSPSFKSTKEDRETTTTKTVFGYNNHFGIFSFGRTASSPTSHEYAYIDFIKSKATTYNRG